MPILESVSTIHSFKKILESSLFPGYSSKKKKTTQIKTITVTTTKNTQLSALKETGFLPLGISIHLGSQMMADK